MPRKQKSTQGMAQQSLFDYLDPKSSTSRQAENPAPQTPKNRSMKRKRSDASSRRGAKVVEPEFEEAEEGNTSSDVEAIRLSPSKPIVLSSDDSDEQRSPKRPKKAKAAKISIVKSRSASPTQRVSDEEGPSIPARLKGKSVIRKAQVVESDEEEEEEPRRRKLVKGVRPPTPDDSDDSDDSLNEEDILDTRLRSRDKRSAYQQNLERLKRKKKGQKASNSSEQDDSDAEGSGSEGPSVFPGAKPHIGTDDEDEDDTLEDDDFIVEDDSQTVVPALPSAFNMSSHQDLAHHFKVVCQLFVHMAVRPARERKPFMQQSLKENEYFAIPLQTARSKLSGMRDSLITSSVWRPDFKKPLETYPELNLTRLGFAVPHCDACHLGGRLSTIVGRLDGKPYDKFSFRPKEEESDFEDSDSDNSDENALRHLKKPKEFNLGRFCAARTRAFHQFSHWEWSLYQTLSEEIESLQPAKGNKKRQFVRVAYVKGLLPPEDLSDADGIMDWLDQRGVINMEWHKPSQQGGTPGAYPYSAAYQHGTPGMYGHPQTPGTYPYQASGAYPATAVPGYGTHAWPYPYSYYQHQQYQQTSATISRPATSAAPTPAPTTTAPSQPTPTTAAPTRTTFSLYAPVYPREGVTTTAPTTGGTTRGYRKQSNFKGLFNKELRSLMYGFGDDRNPANDSVSVMEEILVEYIADVCQSALAPTKKSRLSIEDLRRALSRNADANKLARMEELLFMQEDIKRARAQFDDSEINQGNALQR
ncbi:hypothetical protein EWM64_g6105 [Hericium alpestre]|uniref:Transcription initiation factor TFIID subunit 13 n=1 Tax=Hericium alpestre TaxID=135208 RepID=A0A4Y9ZV27_9AGAM|nr:hypothetical protein EWM64_g6105 [Hericium alpestre]